jgi:hypothetical protein
MPLLTRGRHNAAAHSWERRNILASSKALVYLFAIATCLGVSSPVASQELLELARAQAIRRPGRPVEIPAAPAHNQPKTLDQLTNEAVAVVQVTLSRINSYVGSRGDRVLTDYLITTPMVIAGELPAPTQRVPRPGTSPILTVYGGEVVLEGVTVRCTDNIATPSRMEHSTSFFCGRPERLVPLVQVATRFITASSSKSPGTR